MQVLFVVQLFLAGLSFIFYDMAMQTLICKQCGTCCRKGGPLLHKADAPLVLNGHIAFSQLLTLRAGELAHDPVRNTLIPLEQEVVKIIGTAEAQYPWHCVLHGDAGCGLHPLRPAQCKALFCADTTEIEMMYHEERLSRHDILHVREGWLELAEAHEEQCPLRPLVAVAEELYGAESCEGMPTLVEELLQNIRYDLAFRELCREKAALDDALLACVLGRPVHVFLRSLGFEVYTQTTGDLCVKKLAKAPYFS